MPKQIIKNGGNLTKKKKKVNVILDMMTTQKTEPCSLCALAHNQQSLSSSRVVNLLDSRADGHIPEPYCAHRDCL